MFKEILLMSLMLLPVYSVNASRVGLVVEFPNNAVFTECIDVKENANAYEILQKSSLETAWSFHSVYGHGLCAVFDTSCPADDCFCSARYWNFYIKKSGENSWTNSPVRFDGESSCSEHYCAVDGDLLGFTYDMYDIKPPAFTFRDICPGIVEDKHVEEPDIIGRVVAFPGKNLGLISGALLFLLLIAYFVYKPWEYF